MLLYLLGPGDWAFSLVNGLADVLDDTPSCPDHSPPRDRVLHDAILDTAGLHYAGPFAPSCAYGCDLHFSSLPHDFLPADVVFFWLPEVTPFLSYALALASAYAKNVWAAGPVPLPSYLASLPDDLVYRPDPESALRDMVNRHHAAWCHVMPYEEYLATPTWHRTRILAIDRAGGKCQLCNKESSLQVHHRTYANRGAELPEDLIALCRRCHANFHDTVPFIGPAMKGPDLRSWKLASITRYFQTPSHARESDEGHYRRHEVCFDPATFLEYV